MKKFLIILVSIFSNTSMAKAGTTKYLNKNELESYKKAVILALAGKQQKCRYSDQSHYMYNLEQIIPSTTSANITEDGKQPILTFFDDDKESQVYLKVTSTADYMSILSVEATFLKWIKQEVNVGSLLKPVIIEKSGFVPYFTANCTFE
ncbi:MAG: hypothetical protein ACXVCP_18040 [Bdellovibrio sp.]